MPLRVYIMFQNHKDSHNENLKYPHYPQCQLVPNSNHFLQHEKFIRYPLFIRLYDISINK